MGDFGRRWTSLGQFLDVVGRRSMSSLGVVR